MATVDHPNFNDPNGVKKSYVGSIKAEMQTIVDAIDSAKGGCYETVFNEHSTGGDIDTKWNWPAGTGDDFKDARPIIVTARNALNSLINGIPDP